MALRIVMTGTDTVADGLNGGELTAKIRGTPWTIGLLFWGKLWELLREISVDCLDYIPLGSAAPDGTRKPVVAHFEVGSRRHRVNRRSSHNW